MRLHRQDGAPQLYGDLHDVLPRRYQRHEGFRVDANRGGREITQPQTTETIYTPPPKLVHTQLDGHSVLSHKRELDRPSICTDGWIDMLTFLGLVPAGCTEETNHKERPVRTMHGIIVSLCSDLTGIHVEDCPSSILQHKNTKTNKRKRVGLLNVQRNVCAVIHSFLSIQTLPPPQPGGGGLLVAMCMHTFPKCVSSRTVPRLQRSTRYIHEEIISAALVPSPPLAFVNHYQNYPDYLGSGFPG